MMMTINFTRLYFSRIDMFLSISILKINVFCVHIKLRLENEFFFLKGTDKHINFQIVYKMPLLVMFEEQTVVFVNLCNYLKSREKKKAKRSPFTIFHFSITQRKYWPGTNKLNANAKTPSLIHNRILPYPENFLSWSVSANEPTHYRQVLDTGNMGVGPSLEHESIGQRSVRSPEEGKKRRGLLFQGYTRAGCSSYPCKFLTLGRVSSSIEIGLGIRQLGCVD